MGKCLRFEYLVCALCFGWCHFRNSRIWFVSWDFLNISNDFQVQTIQNGTSPLSPLSNMDIPYVREDPDGVIHYSPPPRENATVAVINSERKKRQTWASVGKQLARSAESLRKVEEAFRNARRDEKSHIQSIKAERDEAQKRLLSVQSELMRDTNRLKRELEEARSEAREARKAAEAAALAGSRDRAARDAAESQFRSMQDMCVCGVSVEDEEEDHKQVGVREITESFVIEPHMQRALQHLGLKMQVGAEVLAKRAGLDLWRRFVSGTPEEFELWCASLISCKIKWVVVHSGKSGDQGIDLRVFERRGVSKLPTAIVQCKMHRAKVVQTDKLRELRGSMHGENMAWFFTSTRYSKDALDLAASYGSMMALFDRATLIIALSLLASETKKAWDKRVARAMALDGDVVPKMRPRPTKKVWSEAENTFLLRSIVDFEPIRASNQSQWRRTDRWKWIQSRDADEVLKTRTKQQYSDRWRSVMASLVRRNLFRRWLTDRQRRRYVTFDAMLNEAVSQKDAALLCDLAFKEYKLTPKDLPDDLTKEMCDAIQDSGVDVTTRVLELVTSG